MSLLNRFISGGVQEALNSKSELTRHTTTVTLNSNGKCAINNIVDYKKLVSVYAADGNKCVIPCGFNGMIGIVGYSIEGTAFTRLGAGDIAIVYWTKDN